MANYRKTAALWMEKLTDAALKKELSALLLDERELENRFFKELDFGTGGLRGIIGVGSNCLNTVTVAKVTAGLAATLPAGGEVAISYDSRINSRLFAETAARVFALYGLTVHMVTELMPTPFLSFAVRDLKCIAGVMVTASHNPARYNGYKVYGRDGCQLTDDAAAAVKKAIDGIDAFSVRPAPFEKYVKEQKIRFIGDHVKKRFMDAVYACHTADASGLSVTYTPLNGTGYKLVPEILRRAGVSALTAVPEQAEPDGNFTTCPYPNPEKAEALRLGLAAAEAAGSDILIATDPDADRVGIAVLHQGRYVLLTGNETGVLLTEFLLSARKAAGSLPKDPIVLKTIVTSNLCGAVAAEYGAKTVNVLTGFKYIGEQLEQLSERGEAERFIIGFEESYGYLSGAHVRDKDGVVASMLIAEMAAHFKRQGMTLCDALNALYRKYGKYSHRVRSVEFAGAAGSARMQTLLSGLRARGMTEIGGIAVEKHTDYLTQTELPLPRADVLQYDLSGNAQLIVRPSGTEPLIKMYMTAARTDAENETVFAALNAFINEYFK